MLKDLVTCRYLLKLSYIGTNYKGLQRLTSRAKDGPAEDGSIQSAVEHAINRALLPVYDARLALSSRTDAGVHALVNYANVDLTHPLGATIYRPSFVTNSVNYILHRNKHQITLHETRIVPAYFHSRINAKSRSYIYRLAVPCRALNADTFRVSRDSLLPITQLQRCHITEEGLDIRRVQEAMKLFLGEHDFAAFSTASDDGRPTVRTLDRFELFATSRDSAGFHCWDGNVSPTVEYYEILIKSKSFLYNQVRRMVSTVLDVGLNRIGLQDIRDMLRDGRDSRPDGLSRMAPSHGLYLADVEYDQQGQRTTFRNWLPK